MLCVRAWLCGQLCLWRAVHSHCSHLSPCAPALQRSSCAAAKAFSRAQGLCAIALGPLQTQNRDTDSLAFHKALVIFKKCASTLQNQYDAVAAALTIFCLYNILI